MEDALDHALRGRVFANRYRIEERLGEGAMGIVYRAKHIKLARDFAIKVLHPQLLTNEKVRRRFEHEAEVAATLRHDNVIGVVDVGETSEGLCFLVMDYAEGDTLSALIGQGPMANTRMLQIAQRLCDGLQHAHDLGLIHRDFKPDNVIVQCGRDGIETPRIVDFGIALLRDDASPSDRERLTTAGVVLGTPHYMAPEHASGKAIDHRIDLFALGVICFEMLTGRLPFDGDGVEVARANMMFETPPMRAYVPHLDIDPLLEEFTRKLLKRSLDERIGSAREARALLDLIERDRGAAAVALGFEVPTQVTAPSPRPMLAMPIVTPGRVRTPNTLQPESSTSTVILDDRDTIQTRPARQVLPNRYVIAATIATAVLLAGVVALRGRTQMSTATAAVVHPVPARPLAPAIAVPNAAIETAVVLDVARPAPKVVARIAKKAPSTIPPVPHPAPTSSTPAELIPSASELAQLYAGIGRKLSALERARGQDATLELWPRYRNIRIQALLAKPDDRRAGALALRDIERAVDAATSAAP
ncbi:MAG: protein kinase [Myxococcota bacterium]|nr:protein kinase [Myxococcota bacterium]